MTSERVSPTLRDAENSFSSTPVDAGLVAALEAEGEHRAGALRRIFARKLVVFIVRQAGVIDAATAGCASSHSATALALSQCFCMRSGSVLDAGQNQERIDGEIAGPRSRRPSTRQAMAKAKLPKVS